MGNKKDIQEGLGFGIDYLSVVPQGLGCFLSKEGSPG